MDSKPELSLCMAIETALSAQCRLKPELTNALCIIGLDNAIIALKQKLGFARNETVLSRPVIDDIVAPVVSIGVDNVNIDGLTLKNFVAVVHKIKNR